MQTPSLVLLAACFLLVNFPLSNPARGADAPEVKVTADLAYKSGPTLTDYEKERGKLDVYAPADAKNLPCLVWFYGGALTEGSKAIPGTQAICRTLAGEGMVVICPDYRLSPKVKYPAYIEDAAAAVAWARQHAAEYGGDPARLFVGGHSAGGYLTNMLGVDARFLQAVGVEETQIAGFIPLSGQAMTHYTVRDERGLPHDQLIADEAAPINHVKQKTAPWLILCAEHDMEYRVAEDKFFAASLVQAGHRNVTVHEIAGRNHGTVAEWITHPGDTVRAQIVAFVQHPDQPVPAK